MASKSTTPSEPKGSTANPPAALANPNTLYDVVGSPTVGLRPLSIVGRTRWNGAPGSGTQGEEGLGSLSSAICGPHGSNFAWAVEDCTPMAAPRAGIFA